MSIRTQKCKLYKELAPIYDYVMRHVNYRQWADYVQTLFQLSGVEVKTVLDVACGTGSLCLYLKELGFCVMGFDLSPEMILNGIKKAYRADNEFPMWCGDMERFAQRKPVDAIVCLYDSINYLMDHRQWTNVFSCAYNALIPSGLFIFDISTEANSLRHFQDHSEKGHGPNFKFTRYSKYNQTKKVQVNEFHIVWKNKPKQVLVETHKQIVMSIKDVEKLISKSKFSIMGIYDNVSTAPGTESSDRVYFLLQKCVK